MLFRSSPVKTIADLKGKMLGLSHSGNPVEPMLKAYLADFGVKREEIRSQVVGNALPAAEALKSGQIDATMQVTMSYATWREAGYDFRILGEPRQFERLIGAAVGVRRAALADPERRAVIVRFLRGWAKTQLFVKTNPQAAVELDYKLFPQAKPRGMSDADALKRGMNAQDAVMDAYTNKVDGRWGAFRPAAFKDYSEFLGIAADVPDPSPLWTNDLIAEINNFDEAAVIAKARNYKASDYK